jgi:stage IV sporulation protein FB
MFDDFENIYPQKPEITSISKKNNVQKNVMLFVLVMLALIFMLQDSIVMIVTLFGVIAVHELGHFVGMKLFKFKDNKIFYFPILSNLIKQKTDKVSQKHHLITILLGPIPGILIGVLLLNYYFIDKNEIILNISTLFLAINLFSLIPLDPLDGGRIIQSLFFPSNQKIKMYFVLGSSLIFILVGFYSDFYVLMLFGFFMAFKVKSIQKNDSIHEELEDQNVDYKKAYSSLTNREYWKIRTVFLENNPKIRELIPLGDDLWENEKLLTDQISQILKIELKKDASILFKIVVIAILSAAIYLPIDLVVAHWEDFADYIEKANV